MDFIDLMNVAGTLATVLIIYRLFIREKREKTKGHYTRPGETRETKVKVKGFFCLLISISLIFDNSVELLLEEKIRRIQNTK